MELGIKPRASSMFANAFYQLRLSSTPLEFLYGDQRSFRCCSSGAIKPVFEIGSFTPSYWNLSSRVDLPTSKSRDPPVLTSSALAFVKYAFRELNSGPHSCLARTSLTKLFLHSKTWLKNNNNKKKLENSRIFLYQKYHFSSVFSFNIRNKLETVLLKDILPTPSLKFNLSQQATKCFIFLIKRFL